MTVTLGTLAAVFQDTARYAGVLKSRGPATSSSATTVVDAVHELTPDNQDNVVRGSFVTVLGAPVAGQYREITAYASSTYTFGTLTSLTGAVDYCRTTMSPADLIDAIQRASSRTRKRQGVKYRSVSVVTNSLLECFGDFQG